MSSSSSSDDSTSKEKKKKDGKDGKGKKSKKAKKAKKEAKKAKKLAKQIKKLEDEVERRKRQMNGEVQEKKKKKKKETSSSSSSQPAKKLKKGADQGVGDSHEVAHEDQDSNVKGMPQCLEEEMQGNDLTEKECANGCAESVEEPEELPSESSSEESNPERHEGAECDHCEMCPIVGPRFKCSSCEDVSLCKLCYKKRLEVHKPGHRFFAMKPMLGVSSDASEKLKERKKFEKEQQEKEDEKMRINMQSYQNQSIGANAGQWMESNFSEHIPSFLPIHFAPPVQPLDAPEVASKLQERWQSIGQDYKKSWQGPGHDAVSEAKKMKEHKVKDAKPEQEQVTRVGKQLLRGGRCGLCLQQVLDSASGVICAYTRPNASEGGCGKGVCFPCMLRASSMMFGKVRLTKDIWVTLAEKAWWMHERCMTESDSAEFEELIQSFGLKDKLEAASAELPRGWTRRISHTTGKLYFVNAKLGKTQWDLPTVDSHAGEEANEAGEAREQKDEQAAEDESKDSDEELVQL